MGGTPLIFAVDLANKRIYCCCSANKHLSLQEPSEFIKILFLKEMGVKQARESLDKSVKNKHLSYAMPTETVKTIPVTSGQS